MGKRRAARRWLAAAWACVLGCSAGQAAPEGRPPPSPPPSRATPPAFEALTGHWYLAAAGTRRALDFQQLEDGSYEGSLVLESDPAARAPIDALRWDETATPPTLVFHAGMPAGHEWYRVVPAE